jgi:hypothetical protein
MLELDVVVEELYNEETEKFSVSKVRVELEHSLVSMSKWESLWEVPFLGKADRTSEQTISYVQMMLLTENLPPEVFSNLLDNHLNEITKYIEAKMTATRINDTTNKSGPAETITSELIYYWMFSMNIPLECQHWHLNRLITLIRVFNAKNSPKKKMSAEERRALNRQRLAQYNTRG